MFERAEHVHFQKYYWLKVILSDMVSIWLVEEKMQDLWLLHNTVCICHSVLNWKLKWKQHHPFKLKKKYITFLIIKKTRPNWASVMHINPTFMRRKIKGLDEFLPVNWWGFSSGSRTRSFSLTGRDKNNTINAPTGNCILGKLHTMVI